MWQYSFLFVCAVISGGLAKGKTPPFIHPCNDSSEECITKAVRDALPEFTRGIPALGVLPLDPFQVQDIGLTLPGGLKVALSDSTFSGMRGCVVERARLIQTTFEMTTRCNITIKGKYKANGRILLFPINGHGDAKVKVTNIKFHTRMQTKNEIASDGKYHIVFKDYKTRHEWGERIQFHLANLFNGNPELSNTILNFINANWEVVASEFGGPLIDVVIKQIVNTVMQFFAAVPYEDLIGFPPILN